MNAMTTEQRMTELENKLNRMKMACCIGVMGALALMVMGLVGDDDAPIQELTLRKLTIVDDAGKQRIVLGQDPKDTQRRARATGITIYDSQGSERGGLGTMSDGSVVFAMDAPAGVGSPMRDRLGLVVGADGSAYVMLLDNETRAVAKLQSDGKGGGGVQVFKWDKDGKNVHVKTLGYDEDKQETHRIGR